MKTIFKRASKSTLAVVLAVCLLFSCMTVGIIATDAAKTDSESVGATIPNGTTFYLDVTNFSGTYNSSYWLSLSGNSSTTATSSNTSGAASYKPKSDSSWVEMTKVRGNIYSATTTAQSTNGRVSFWSKNESGYDNVWEVNVSLGNLYDGTKNLFTISSGSSTHSDRRAVCFSGTWSVYDSANYYFECPASVISGTDIMFYIKGYGGDNVLTNGASHQQQTGATFNTVDNGNGYAYVQAPKSGVGSYQYITNNPSDWNGNKNSDIGTSSAGKLHKADSSTSTTAAKTAATTPSTTSITTGTASITLSTTCNSTTGVYNSLPLYYQYYLDDTYVASSETAAKTTAQSFTLNTASLAAGSHTVKTILTDGNIFYIADTDTLTISNAAQTFDNIGVAAKYSTTGASNSYTNNMASGSATISATSYTTGTSALTITANSVTGYTFAQWVVTAGSGTIGSTTSASTTFVPGEGGTTVTAQYKKNYTISKNTPTNGTITLNKTSAVAGESYTVTLAPAQGYKVSAFTVGNVDKLSSLSNNVYSGTASGSSATIACSVTFALDDTLKLGVAGRFHVRTTSGGSTWMNTWGSGSGDWSDTGFNGDTAYIPFVWDSTAGKYKVQTYASLAELTSQLSSNTPYLYVYNKTKSKYLYSSTAVDFTTSVTEATLTEYSNKSSTYDTKLKFNSTSTDSPVVLWFDATTNKLSYTVPAFYDVTVNEASNGSVTAAPTRTSEGTTVTLTATPAEGYELSTIAAKKTGDTSTSVTLSGTGNTRTFNMPAYGVTVTPVFSKINYTLTKNTTSNGSFKLTNASGTEISTAQIGDTVKVVPTANTGYQVSTVKHGTSSTPNTTITASSGTYSFTMGAANEYVAVTFSAINYTITSTKTGNGTVTVKKSGASTTTSTYNIGDTLVISATPDNYNQLTNIVVSGAVSGTYTSSPVNLDMTGKTGALTITTTFAETTYTGFSTSAKYSTTAAADSYTNNMTYVPTKGGTSGTNATGISISADETVTEGGVKYKFYQWAVTNGTLTSSASTRSNTFKPTANSAVCTARYKKVYTITKSVDDTGTGKGTVSTSVTEVVAGGSYTITSTVSSAYHAIESVKVNGTSQGSSATTNVTNVTTDQTVLVKFKSRVQIKGTSPINSTAWAGEDMTSNADGTSFSITKTLEAGTTYQFRLYAKGDWVANSVTTWDLNSVATHGTSGDNLTITPTVKVNVTFVSDGTKFTSITAVPYDSTKYTVTFTKVTGSTITGTYMGTSFTTASADATVQVYSGTSINFTVTAASDKYISGVTTSSGTLDPAFNATTHAAEYTGSVTVSAATTITPAVANKLKVTCTTNKTEWGTVSTSPEYARPGETVTITYTAASGTLKTLTVYDTTNSTTIKSWSRDANGDMKVNSAGSQSASFLFGNLNEISRILKNKAGEAVGADDPLTFTMPSGNVTVTATYEEYVGTSEYIYHGVNTSGQAVSGYESKAMSEGIIGGQKYAYYNVTGRESVGYDQLFYISKGGSTDGRYVYFTDKGGTYTDWANHDPTAYFYNSSGAVGGAWPGTAMTWVSGEGSNVDKNWKLEIPAGATGVIFTNGKSGGDFKQTHDINLTNTNGSYYPSGYSSNKYEVSQWTTPGENSGIIAGTDYYWDTDVYKDQWYTGGFNNHDVSNVHNFAKPKDGNGQKFSDAKDDYYIVVLYPNTEYSFNFPGHDKETKTVGSKPMVLWTSTLPGQTETAATYVKVYAKDGAIRRDGDLPERNNRTYSTFEHHANTFVYGDSGYANHIGTRSSNDGQSSEGTGYDGYTYDYIQKFEKGETLYIKTNLKNDTYMNRYYLYAYSINGKCYQIHTVAESQTGSVTEAFTVPEDWEYDYVEITPIYFLRDSSNAITFYVEGYDEEVMHAGWGNTPFVYPFYQDANFNYVTNVNNPFGGYPGQPMVFYKGNYYTQLPRTFDAIPETGGTAVNCTIKGVTLGNGYWDDIHVLTKEVKSHFQTYDYDDLYKIYKEYPKQADHIICSFKYRTKKNNDEPSSLPTANVANYNKTNGNGWELLTDYYGRPVDIFGNIIENNATANDILAGTLDPNTATGVVHAISQDYKSNSAGDYATEWAIYDTTGAKVTGGNKTTIVPSALALTETGHFQNYDSATRAFQGIYEALKAKTTTVVGQPVVVTYEKSIYGGGDKADRCDARWYYSKAGQTINATTRIEYTDDGKNWVTDTYNTGTGTGSHTGTQAYFTGLASTAKDEPDSGSAITGKNTTTISGTTGGGYYTFNAENAGQYEFVGWYLLRDNYQNISVRSSYGADETDFTSHAEQSKNGDIFVARFKKTATGTLDIYHEVHPQTSGYGHVYVEAIVKDAGGTQQGSKIGSISGGTLTDHIQIPSTYIRSGEGYTVVATFKAQAYPTSHFDNFYATIGELLSAYDGYAFIKEKDINIANGTATITYDVDKLFSVASGSPVQTVTSITHYSKFSLRTDLTYNLEYRFTTRYYGDKLYKYTNKAFTAEELRSYFRSQIENDQVDSITIDAQFVQRKAPFESNYREDLTWVIDNVKITNNVGTLTATQVPIKWAKATVYDFTNAGVMSTTTMEAPLEKLFNKNVETKPANASDAATAITNWDTTCTDDKLYTTIRTSYNDGNTTVPLYLHHWEVYRLDSFTYKTDGSGKPSMKTDGFNLDIDTGKSTLVCMSYSTRFNYIGYEDYAIVPVYTTDPMSTPERQALSDSRTDSSATLLTITRNHWNTTVSGSADSGKYGEANTNYDRLYVDFMLNYNYSKNGQNILLSTTGDNIKVGFIVKSYTIDYSGGTGEKVYSGNSKVYVFTDNEKKTIDNKNRIEYCYGFANSQNNSQYGLNFEFTPFIIDTNQEGAGQSITLPNNGGTHKNLYADSTVSVLDGVNFYMIGKSDTSWDT